MNESGHIIETGRKDMFSDTGLMGLGMGMITIFRQKVGSHRGEKD